MGLQIDEEETVYMKKQKRNDVFSPFLVVIS